MGTILAAALLSPGAAFAQVSVNQGALDRLQPSAPATHKAPAKPAAHAPARRTVHPSHPSTTHASSTHPAPAHPAPPSSRASKLRPGLPPAVPVAPPAGVVLPPPVVAPARPVQPPPAVPPVAAATGAVAPIKGGVRITFGGGSSDMTAGTEAAIRTFAATMKASPNADVNLYAFAAGVPDDPSTPRRVSLSRALAVRAILIGEGIVSTRIYPRALGSNPSPIGLDGPPDRVDLVLDATAAATP